MECELYLILTGKFPGQRWFLWQLFGLCCILLFFLSFFLSFWPHCLACLLRSPFFLTKFSISDTFRLGTSRHPKTLWDFQKLATSVNFLPTNTFNKNQLQLVCCVSSKSDHHLFGPAFVTCLLLICRWCVEFLLVVSGSKSLNSVIEYIVSAF